MSFLASIVGAEMAEKAAPYVSKGLKGLAIVGVLSVLMILSYCKGAEHKENELENERLEAQIEILGDIAESNEEAGGERLADSEELAEEAQELEDARSVEGDDFATRRARSLCRKLQQQGVDTSEHPTCGRFAGGSGAGPPE